MSGTNRQGTVRSTAGPSGVRTTTWRSCSHRVADGHDEAAAHLELLVQGLGQVRRGGRDRDRGERRVLRKAAAAVADVHVHTVAVPCSVEQLARAVGERRDPLDRVHLARELGEHRGLVAGAGADIEDAFSAVQLELLADARHHVRLRDRLTLADGQRRVGVRTAVQLGRHEQLARNAFHGGEHALVDDAARAQLSFDHRVTLSEHRR